MSFKLTELSGMANYFRRELGLPERHENANLIDTYNQEDVEVAIFLEYGATKYVRYDCRVHGSIEQSSLCAPHMTPHGAFAVRCANDASISHVSGQRVSGQQVSGQPSSLRERLGAGAFAVRCANDSAQTLLASQDSCASQSAGTLHVSGQRDPGQRVSSQQVSNSQDMWPIPDEYFNSNGNIELPNDVSQGSELIMKFSRAEIVKNRRRVVCNALNKAKARKIARKAIVPKTVARNAVARNAVVRNAVARNAVARKATVPKTVARNAVARNAVARNAVARNAVARNAVARNAVARNAAACYAVARNLVAHYAAAQRTVAQHSEMPAFSTMRSLHA